MRKLLSKRTQTQKGATLVELLVSIGILGISITGLMDSVKFMQEEVKLTEQSGSIYENDQMIRYELGMTFEQFQKNIIQPRSYLTCDSVPQIDPSRPGNPPLIDPKTGNQVLLTPWTILRVSQQNFAYSKDIYFGPYTDLYNSGIPTFSNEIDSSFKDINKFSKQADLKLFFDAYSRCKTSQTVGIKTSSIRGRSSIYTCGYGVGILVEAKVVFWDSFSGKPLLCEAMNGNAGRGLQILYTVYNFRPKYDANNKKSYFMKKYDGRLYVPKRVDTGFDDFGGGVWDEPK